MDGFFVPAWPTANLVVSSTLRAAVVEETIVTFPISAGTEAVRLLLRVLHHPLLVLRRLLFVHLQLLLVPLPLFLPLQGVTVAFTGN